MVFLMVLISTAVGFGSAFYFQRKINMLLLKKSQRVLNYVAMISFGIGFSGLLNQILSQPMLGMAMDYDKAAGNLLVKMLIIPAIIYMLVWALGFLGEVKSKTSSQSLLSQADNYQYNVDSSGGLSKVQLSEEELNGIYAIVYDELEENKMDKGLWARCFAFASGDVNQAKAKYIELRASNLIAVASDKKKTTGVESSANMDASSSLNDFPNRKLAVQSEFSLFWNSFNVIGKLGIIGVAGLLILSFFVENK